MVKLTELECWRWLPGMRYGQRFDDGDGSFTTYGRLLWNDNKGCLESHAPDCGAYGWWKPDPGIEPDLTDPATQGAIVFGLLAPMGWQFVSHDNGKVSLWKPLGLGRGTLRAERLPLAEAIEAALRMEG